MDYFSISQPVPTILPTSYGKNDYVEFFDSVQMFVVKSPETQRCEEGDGLPECIFLVEKTQWEMYGRQVRNLSVEEFEEDNSSGGHGYIITYNMRKLYDGCVILRVDPSPEIVEFVRQIENSSFVEKLDHAIERYGVELEDDDDKGLLLYFTCDIFKSGGPPIRKLLKFVMSQFKATIDANTKYTGKQFLRLTADVVDDSYVAYRHDFDVSFNRPDPSRKVRAVFKSSDGQVPDHDYRFSFKVGYWEFVFRFESAKDNRPFGVLLDL